MIMLILNDRSPACAGLFFVTPGQRPFVTGSSMGLGIRVEGLRLKLNFQLMLSLKLSRFSC